MANWLRTLRLAPEYEQPDEGIITIQQLAGIVAARLLALEPLTQKECHKLGEGEREELASRKEDIVEMFQSIEHAEAGNLEDDQEEFNYAMEELYEWADTPTTFRGSMRSKLCWVDTLGVSEPAEALT